MPYGFPNYDSEQLETDYLVKKLWSDNAKLSCQPAAVRYQKQTKKKSNTALKDAALIILSIALGANLASGFIKKGQETRNAQDLQETLGGPVKSNIHYGNYNVDRAEYDWYYDLISMAKSVLDTNSEYSIDARIYGCYKAMNPYNKMVHMNELFHQIQRIITSSPGIYPPDVERIATFNSFEEYLSTKGLDQEAYVEFMEKIVAAYAKSDAELKTLLVEFDNLGGGSR